MKKHSLLTVCALASGLIAGAALPAAANVVTTSATSIDDVTIPDNDPNGVAETINLNTSIVNVENVQVNLDVLGGFNGDYYAYLEHGSTGFAVLLNRVGVTTTNAFGYADSGFDITLVNGGPDIHNYQNLVNPGGGALTGTWGVDGRNVDPSVVTSQTPQTALLTSFDGFSGSGNWTLFIADESPLGVGELEDWSLTVTGDNGIVSTPDATTTLTLLTLSACLLLVTAPRKRSL